ncbi:hypothetical protein BJY16_003312 [Actinoplanes octamycinicus]|uniref:Uncharacterized protein n=1 Tax=Actinoplanes octamycinicus TaxID=135948 RepID=A0A7W7GX19_9ACTN|nr:hypothetical protein [Actinoplanes octamycinicus]
MRIRRGVFAAVLMALAAVAVLTGPGVSLLSGGAA